MLYLVCQNGLKKLGTTLELLQWKATNGVSDKRFGDLLKLVKKMLSKDNELPTTTYEAKQLVCLLGLEVQKIHACPTTASSTEASTRIWMHVPYAVHCVTRLEKMILAMSRGSLPGREFLRRSCGIRL